MDKELSLFAKNIRYLRKGKHLTLAEIESSTGFKQSTWSNYENGVSEPDFNGLINISKFFKVQVDDILLKDLGNVHLFEGKQGASSAIKGTSKSVGNSASKKDIGSVSEVTSTDVLSTNQTESSRDWVLAKMIQDNSQKLDQVLVLLKKQEEKINELK